MKHPKLKIILLVYVLLNIADIVSTVWVKIKQPYFNEVNPIYLLTGNLLLFLGVKVGIVGLVLLIFLKWYNKRSIYVRYFLTTILFINILGLTLILPGNFQEVAKQPSEVKQISTSVRQEHVKQNFVKPISYMYLVLLGCFIFWHQIDKEVISYDRRIS